MKNINDLKFVRLNRLSDDNSENIAMLNSSYLLWKSIWIDTWQELGIDKKVTSDDFLDRECIGLFDGNNAVALMLHREFDLDQRADLDHSYFNAFPESLLKNIINEKVHKKVSIATYFTVDKEWRRSKVGDASTNKTNLPISEVLFGLSVRTFLVTKTTALLGYSRNDRRVNLIRYRHGGQPLLKNHPIHNTTVDFTITTKATAKDSDIPGVSECVQHLWEHQSETQNPIKKAG